jgi:ketosteroid isomerase-like protein
MRVPHQARLWAVTLALAWSWCGVAQAAETAETAEKVKLKQLSDAWDQAIVAKNRDAVAGNMGDDFRIIDGQGNVGNKEQFVADILDPKLTIDPYTVEEFEIRLYGEVALISGRTRMTGKQDGKPFESNYRYIDVYVERGGKWQIVSVQITRLPN